MKSTQRKNQGKEQVIHNLTIEDAQLIFRNFSGIAGRFNQTGRRSFAVLIDEDNADKLVRDGWNIRWLKAKNEGEPDQAILQVAVNFGSRPPKIAIVGQKNHLAPVTEETISVLDFADFEKVDLIVTPYAWEVNGKTGVKAYLKTMYVTLVEDELSAKYAEPSDDNEDGSKLEDLIP